MASRHDGLPVHLGGASAVCLFALSLVAFVAETQLTQYVQADLGFRQPFLIFYIVHSAFTIMLPLHLFYLRITSKHSSRAIWSGLILALSQRLRPNVAVTHRRLMFPRWEFVCFILLLTAGLTFPSLLWFIAVSLAPVTDVTALWNTNAFFAYVLSVWLFKLQWDPRRLAAVVLATLGATAVVYGGSNADPIEEQPTSLVGLSSTARAPLFGDLLTLTASILYSVYQVLYKMYAALPSDPEHLDSAGLDSDSYTPIPSAVDGPAVLDDTEYASPDETDVAYPPPFGLYPNMLTSAVGLCTLLVLWIPIPILNHYGVMHVHLPSTSREVLVIAGIALSGCLFNAGFMTLLGTWGPIVTSVGSLLTIVLVFISDIIFGGAVETVTPWSLIGSGSIVFAFTVLAYDMMRRRSLSNHGSLE
ncbi:hypothetical protein WOLCODRAFT_93949 [Wolfiporia cocos MD-104 SS10]|uniref:EamA domain-containing protein n=1 Tax=Wolfiporia cocos (strain MD-104) TaxID=742152 RepID=A0A2H3IUM3_WOLCO|nr:hypothetical protein WOLCODRAFT_93949 [Wolfiporia cocos MD-104 SS10]